MIIMHEQGADPMVSRAHPKLAAASLLVLLIVGTVPAREESSPIVAPPRPDSGIDACQLSAEAGVVHRYVTRPLPGELRWQQIPWLLDLDEAMRQAKDENRPLLLFVSGDEPLGRC
jgi:hypothetical protein